MNDAGKNILERSMRNVNTKETTIVPCNTNVVLSFYEENPYRHVDVLDSGLILSVTSEKKYKSNESGEMEDSEEYIACAKVIAVGPGCRNVDVGDDVFAVKHIATPLPYRNKGYYVITEQNIICKIV